MPTDAPVPDREKILSSITDRIDHFTFRENAIIVGILFDIMKRETEVSHSLMALEKLSKKAARRIKRKGNKDAN